MILSKKIEYNFYVWFNVIFHISIIPDEVKNRTNINIGFIF